MRLPFFDWSFPLAFIWGILVIVSLAGWGQTLGRWLIYEQRREQIWGWGLASAWGLAAFLVLSGPLVLTSQFSSTFVAFYLLSGLTLAASQACFRERAGRSSNQPGYCTRAIFSLTLPIICLTYTGAVASQWYNANDDFSVYFAHTKMLLDTGTFSDPFGLRLMMSLGGQQTLSALLVAFLPWKYANLLDEGIALLIILGLIIGQVSGGDARAWMARLTLLMVALTFSMPRINTGSALTGVVLFMALFQTLKLNLDGRLVGWRTAVLVSGLISALATLRGHFIFLIAFIGAAFVLFRLYEDRARWGTIMREAGMTLLGVIIFLVPWWIVTYRSSGAFLYPLIKGTQRPEFETFDMNLSWMTTLQFTAGFFIHTIYPLLFCPICFMEAGKSRRWVLVLGGAIFVSSSLFLWKYTYGDYFSAFRYLAPIGVAFAFYSAGMVAQQFVKGQGLGSFSLVRAKLMMISIYSVLLLQCIPFWNTSLFNIFSITWAVHSRHEFSDFAHPVSTQEARRDYGEAFGLIAPGSKILIALDYPFLLDYQKHSIFSIDIPGAASPYPGLPYFKGAEPVKEYLKAQGINYVAHVPFHSEFLYSREKQTANLSADRPIWHLWGRYEINFFDNIEALAKTNPILYDSPTIQVIELK